MKSLEDHVANCCSALSDFGWSDLFRVLGDEEALDRPEWVEAVAKAQFDSRPWLPAPGKTSQTVLAFPEGVPRNVRRAISQRFPDHKIVEECNGESVLFVQTSQVYYGTGSDESESEGSGEDPVDPSFRPPE